MSIGFLFWIIWIFALLFGGFYGWRSNGGPGWFGGGLVVWVLFFLLGLATFGSPIKG